MHPVWLLHPGNCLGLNPRSVRSQTVVCTYHGHENEDAQGEQVNMDWLPSPDKQYSSSSRHSGIVEAALMHGCDCQKTTGVLETALLYLRIPAPTTHEKP